MAGNICRRSLWQDVLFLGMLRVPASVGGDALAKLTLAMRPKACLLSVCLTVQTADATCATSYPGMPASSPILPLSHLRLCMPITSSLSTLLLILLSCYCLMFCYDPALLVLMLFCLV
jgi:hypothetical protein